VQRVGDQLLLPPGVAVSTTSDLAKLAAALLDGTAPADPPPTTTTSKRSAAGAANGLAASLIDATSLVGSH